MKREVWDISIRGGCSSRIYQFITKGRLIESGVIDHPENVRIGDAPVGLAGYFIGLNGLRRVLCTGFHEIS